MKNIVRRIFSHLWQEGSQCRLSSLKQHICNLHHIFVNLRLVIQKRRGGITKYSSRLLYGLLKRGRGVIDNLFAASHEFLNKWQCRIRMTICWNVKEHNLTHTLTPQAALHAPKPRTSIRP